MFRVDGNASGESKKPNHVRKLNFGQSILTLDRVKRFQRQRDGALWFDSNLANMPCTAKDDFVRKWIETYDNSTFDRKEKPNLSAVLGLSATQAVQTSPLLGNQRKRDKQKGTLPLAVRNAESGRSNESERLVLEEEIPSFLTDNDKCPKVCCDDRRNGNVKRNLFDSASVTISSMPTLTSVSPVLLRNSYSYRKKQRKLNGLYSQRQLLECFKSKCTEINTKSPSSLTKARTTNQSPILGREFHCYTRKRGKQKTKENLRILDGAKNSCIDSNMNSVVSPYSTHLKDSKDANDQVNMSRIQKRCALLEKLGNNFKGHNFNSWLCKDSKISEESVRSHLSLSKAKLKIEDCTKGCVKGPIKMEIQFSNKNDDDSLTHVKDINNDTEQDFSDHIEDVDTQDLVALAAINNHILTDSSAYTRPKSVMLRPHTSYIDSDQTFFSEADQFHYTTLSIQSSPKVSHISSQVMDNRDSRSSQTGIIVCSETSPPRASIELTMQLTFMDSGKKRKKPKRGSLMGKLQSAINRRVSFVRIWKHHLKQTIKQNTFVPCVTIFVQSCTIRFGRQFLEGAALEDHFSLLPPKEANKSDKYLTIMTVPEVTGKTEMKSEGLVQIFPPWETLDAEKLVLHVTYIHTIPNDEIVARQLKLNIRQINKRSIFKEFHCPCISANKMDPSCKNGTNKPNVMEKLAH